MLQGKSDDIHAMNIEWMFGNWSDSNDKIFQLVDGVGGT